jgi:hypothetical protein
MIIIAGYVRLAQMVGLPIQLGVQIHGHIPAGRPAPPNVAL